MNRHEIYRLIISYIYPNVCPCCEEIIEHDDDFCDRCRNKLIMYNDEFKINHADHFVSYCYYEGKIRYAIRKYKITPSGNSYYAFAFGIVQALRQKKLTGNIDAVVYMPMTKDDLFERGYNQVKLMAKEVHFLLNIPVYNALLKVKSTKSQKSLNSSERKTNIIGAFSINPKVSVEDKTILLIDDLCTTGSTLSEAARVLKEAGAKKVIAASFSKTRKATQKA